MPNPVVHFDIQSSDVEKSQAFFTEVFGWKLDVMPEMNYSIVDTQSDSGIGGGIGGSPDEESHVTFYIEVEDPQASLDRVVAAGGQVIMPVTSIPGAVTLAMFADPAGAVVGLVASETPPAQ